MKRESILGTSASRVWILLGASLLVIAAVLLLMAFMRPGAAAPEPTSAPATAEPTTAAPPTDTSEPSPTPSPVVAAVNEYTITGEYLERATALNQVLSDFAGQESLGESETLQRLIKQQLVLQGAPPKEEPTEDDVEDYIGRMQEAWAIDEETMVAELETVSVDRAFLEETIHRLLSVQTSVDQLSQEGQDVNTWLNEQQEKADIRIYQDPSELSEAPLEEEGEEEEEAVVEESDAATTPSVVEATLSPDVPPTATPAPQPEVPTVAPDFTLDRAGGGQVSLEGQLEEGPVVLVFFQRCG